MMRTNFTPDPNHQCAAIGCDAKIPRGHLMCLRHWDMLSSTPKAEIYRTWRGGRVFGNKINYLIAVAGARLNIATHEKQPQEVRDALMGQIERLRKQSAAASVAPRTVNSEPRTTD